MVWKELEYQSQSSILRKLFLVPIDYGKEGRGRWILSQYRDCTSLTYHQYQ